MFKMEKEFNLSEKIWAISPVINCTDIKEFIKRLKEIIRPATFLDDCAHCKASAHFLEKIDKLAGDKLI